MKEKEVASEKKNDQRDIKYSIIYQFALNQLNLFTKMPLGAP